VGVVVDDVFEGVDGAADIEGRGRRVGVQEWA